MATVSLPVDRPRPVRSTIRKLRGMVRLYVLMEGFAAVMLLLGAVFWIALGIDWVFEPSPLVRGFMWAAVLAAGGWIAYRSFFRRFFASISDSSLALLLEQRYPQLQESLVTTVEATGPQNDGFITNLALLRQTSANAESAIKKVELLPVFRLQPLLWKFACAALLWTLILVLSATQSEVFAFWLQRMKLDPQLWPRQVQLSVDGFVEIEGRRVFRVAIDDDFDLQVKASLEDGHSAPERVAIRYRLPDGRRGRDNMVKVGEALPGRDDAQLFRYTFQTVSSDFSFDVIGGDDRIRDLWLQVVDRPQISRIVVDCNYPAYLNRGPENVPVPSRVELPEGTQARCRVTCTKQLASLRIHDPSSQTDLPATIHPEDPFQAEFQLGQVTGDRVLLLTALDQDGVENREPYRVVVSMIPDSPPEVSVGISGIGSAITPQANIPLEGSVSDDYGLAEIWYETQTDDHLPQRRELDAPYFGRVKFTRFASLDLAKADPQTGNPVIDLKPGAQLSLSVHASDEYDLSEVPHVGRSHRFLLDVVTESELRALLEKRELTLRQRFEAIYEKMVASHELLQRIELEFSNQLDEEEARRLKQRDSLRVGGCLQNAAQLSYETLGVAEGFEGIIAELVNNRIDTEELKRRLGSNIAAPLRTIADEMLPDLQSSLKLLERAYDDSTPLESLHRQSVMQSDVIVATMKQVLDRMLELESYNELVALLRSIVSEQAELQEKTKQERRDRLRNILGDD